MNELTERTRRHVRTMFGASAVDTVERLLADRCGNNLPGLRTASSDQLERIRFAAIRVSGGRLHGLSEAIDLAALDWRDLLVVADFADDLTAHASWQPRAFDAEMLNQWFSEASLPGVAFSPNQPVIVRKGTNETETGSVISLEALEPEPRYLVELASGAELTVFQRHLASTN